MTIKDVQDRIKASNDILHDLENILIGEAMTFEALPYKNAGLSKMYWIVTRVPGGYIYESDNPNQTQSVALFVPKI